MNKKRKCYKLSPLAIMLGIAILFVSGIVALASSSANYRIPVYTSSISSSGIVSSNNHKVNYLVGQPIHGETSGGDRKVQLGFNSASGVSLSTPVPVTPSPTATSSPTPMPSPTVTPQPQTANVFSDTGGVLTSTNVQVVFPPQAVITDTVVNYSNQPARDTGTLVGVNEFFELQARQGDTPITTFNQPLTVTVNLPQGMPVVSETIQLYWLNGTLWSTEGITLVKRADGKLVSLTDHFTLFTLLGDSHKQYLPLISK